MLSPSMDVEIHMGERATVEVGVRTGATAPDPPRRSRTYSGQSGPKTCSAVANVTRCRQLTVESKICRYLPSDLTVERRSNDQGRVSTLCRNPPYLG